MKRRGSGVSISGLLNRGSHDTIAADVASQGLAVSDKTLVIFIGSLCQLKSMHNLKVENYGFLLADLLRTIARDTASQC